MIPILYESTETAFVSNGLGRLRDCPECVVTEERNGSYEIEFTYPVSGAHFEDITLGRIIGATHDEGGDIQPFIITSCSKPISGLVTFRGVHISYRLNKKVMYYRPSGSIPDIMFYLEAVVNPGFAFLTDFPASGNIYTLNSTYPISVRRYLGGMEGSLLDMYGGEYEFDKLTVNYLQSRGQKRNFSIIYGVNMSEYEEEIDYTDTFTTCVPYWISSDGGYIKGDVVDSGATPYDGIDNCVPLDLSDKFEDKPTKAQLNSAALQYMANNKTYLPEQNISVDFVRLQDTPEYERFTSLLTCKLCDTVGVKFPMYGMEAEFKIVKTEWDVLADRYTSMELGDLQTTLADVIGTGSESSRGVEIVTVNHELIEDGSQTISNYYNTTYTVTKSGYVPLGIVGHDVTGTNRKYMQLSSCFIESSSEGQATVRVFLSNLGSSSWAGALTVDILWMKM